VTAGDVAGFVRDDTDHLVGRVGLHQRAGVYEDVLAIEHEGVEGIVLHNAHLDTPRAEPGRLEQRSGVVAEDVLNLTVADQRQILCRRRGNAGDGRNGGETAQHGELRPLAGREC
jgi:hypothetical protein